MKVKPALIKQRKCFALIWESDVDFEVSLLDSDLKQLPKILDAMQYQISVEDPAKLERTVRFGVYVGIYFQSMFRADSDQPLLLSDLDPELDGRPLIFRDDFRKINLIGDFRSDGNL